MLGDSHTPTHSIKIVCQRTGLTAHAIRVWERRYGLVCCDRTSTNRRLYSDQEIEKLKLLKLLTDAGHRIGNICNLSLENLSILQLQENKKKQSQPTDHQCPEACLELCYQEITQMNVAGLVGKLEEARTRYGNRNTLLRVLTPLVHEVESKTRRGYLRCTHEYMVVNAVRDFIAIDARNRVKNRKRPEIVICNPIGEHREIGANIATALSRDLGWNATYLGRNLPSEEIVYCAKIRKAWAVGVGLTHPENEETLLSDLKKLRETLPPHVRILLGGPAASSYYNKLNDSSLYWVENLKQLETIFAEIESQIRHA